jgi:NitT/TauT family transport system permease protein
MSGMIAIGVVGMAIDVALRQGESWLRRRRGLES